MSKLLCLIGWHDWGLQSYQERSKLKFVVYLVCMRCRKCTQYKELSYENRTLP